jgi:serine/threonine protein phosphatase PrpC
MRVRAKCATHAGPRAKDNEDAFGFVDDESAALGVVVDGVGGRVSGRRAADFTVETCAELFRGRSTSILDELAEVWWLGEHGEGTTGARTRSYSTLPIADRVALRDRVGRILKERNPESMGDVAVLEAETQSLLAIPQRSLERANGIIFKRSEQNWQDWRNQAASAVCAVFAAGSASVGHVGLCRAYVVHDRDIDCVTREHSLRNHVLSQPDMGSVPEEELQRLPNVFTRGLGLDARVDVDARTISVEPGDFVLLASDGLWKLFSSKELLDAIRRHGCTAAAYLVDQGKRDRPSHPNDNLTAVVVEVLET